MIDNERPQIKSRAGFGWTDYYSLTDIYKWMDGIVAQHSDIAKVVVGGRSHEGREIRGVKIEFDKVGIFPFNFNLSLKSVLKVNRL